MALTFKASTTATVFDGTGGVPLTITVPAGTSAKDLLLVVIGDDGTGLPPTWSSEGWTQVADFNAAPLGSNKRLTFFQREASNDEPASYDFVRTVDDLLYAGVMLDYSGTQPTALAIAGAGTDFPEDDDVDLLSQTNSEASELALSGWYVAVFWGGGEFDWTLDADITSRGVAKTTAGGGFAWNLTVGEEVKSSDFPAVTSSFPFLTNNAVGARYGPSFTPAVAGSDSLSRRRRRAVVRELPYQVRWTMVEGLLVPVEG